MTLPKRRITEDAQNYVAEVTLVLEEVAWQLFFRTNLYVAPSLSCLLEEGPKMVKVSFINVLKPFSDVLDLLS
jgi:ATP-dependent phosphoenolpyruvate carboxykinase